jgi:hypothetical protein
VPRTAAPPLRCGRGRRRLRLSGARRGWQEPNDTALQWFVGDCRNRWFDKSFQMFVDAAGCVGLNGELGCCDATVISHLFGFAQVTAR